MTINKTYSPKPSEIEKAWHVVDATDLPLGRLASEVAQILRQTQADLRTAYGHR